MRLQLIDTKVMFSRSIEVGGTESHFEFKGGMVTVKFDIRGRKRKYVEIILGQVRNRIDDMILLCQCG